MSRISKIVPRMRPAAKASRWKAKKMEYFDQNEPPEIPHDLFQCPICGAQVAFVEINEYETETGKVTDTGFHVSCTTEPDFDYPDYDEWLNNHFAMPYVDWLPLEARIYKWLSVGFRVRLPTTRALDSLKDGGKKPEFVIFDDIHHAGN